ncbi:MAG: hypothetical protein ABSH48_08650 [Verrucomicrobiota bacterium]
MKRQAPTFPGPSQAPKPFVLISASAVDVPCPAWPGSSNQPGSHHVFTAFHFFVLVAISAGLALGAVGGAKLYGAAGGLFGALVGAGVGFIVGRCPQQIVLQTLSLRLAQATSDELRSFLRRPDCQISNLVLLELQRRGEDIHRELSLILDLLESSDLARRGRGWAALTSAFPALAAQIRDYRLGDSVAECRRRIAKLRSVV